jgi:hypothetical protein
VATSSNQKLYDNPGLGANPAAVASASCCHAFQIKADQAPILFPGGRVPPKPFGVAVAVSGQDGSDPSAAVGQIRKDPVDFRTVVVHEKRWL